MTFGELSTNNEKTKEGDEKEEKKEQKEEEEVEGDKEKEEPIESIGLKKLKEALQQRERERSNRRRSGVTEAWVWHDDDELLAYEDLLEDFHQR